MTATNSKSAMVLTNNELNVTILDILNIISIKITCCILILIFCTKYAKKNAFVMHPGPMNRGVEIDSKLADDVTRSLIQEQVAMGVAVRMACLDLIIKNRDDFSK